MYWSDFGIIEVAEMDGQNRRTVAVLEHEWWGQHDARGLALDVETNRLYFVSFYLSSLLYIDLNSTGNVSVETLFEDYLYLWSPRGVALDDQFVYWNEYWTENVYRINKTTWDGRLDVIASRLYSPRGMVVKKGNPMRESKY